MKITKIKNLLTAIVVFGIITPIAVYAVTDSKTTTINAVIASTISMTTSGTVTLNITPTTAGSQSSASDTVTVATNNATGYVLTLSDADTVTNLAKGSDTITAHTGTQASPSALANNTWGYRVDSAGGFGAGPTTSLANVASSTQTFAGVPSSAAPNTLKTTASVASGDVTTVWYSTKVTTVKPNGTYSDVITYTATTN